MAARAAGFETRSPFAVAGYARFFKSWLRWPSLAARLQILYLGRPLMSPAVIFQQLVRQTRRFVRAYKKLHDNVARDVNAAIKVVAARPAIGERKKGDLAELLVYKFHSQNQLYLLSYSIDEAVYLVYLEAIGSHENFYRDLKHS